MRIASLAVMTCMSIFTMQASAADAPRDSGLSREQATEVAVRFHRTMIRMESTVGSPATLQGDDWAFPLKVGYAGTVARAPILVNRHTGKASWAGLAQMNADIERMSNGK